MDESFSKLLDLIDSINFDRSYISIDSQIKSDGGLPSQFANDPKTGAWVTANVVLLHRKTNFLNISRISKVLSFFVKSFCINKNGDNINCGWGTLSDITNKEPILIITSYVLLALCGVHFVNERLSKIYELALIWLIKNQNKEGYWDETNSYYFNMCIIICLNEQKKIFDKEGVLTKAIENSLTKAKEYYSTIKIEQVSECEKPFYYILAKYLDIDIKEYAGINEDINLNTTYISPNKTYGQENFACNKNHIIYYLYLAAIDAEFLKQHINFIEKIVSHIKDRQQDNGFWTVPNNGHAQDCIWLTCDILRFMKILKASIKIKGTDYYSDICVCNFEIPWYIYAYKYIRIALSAKKTLGQVVKIYSNWIAPTP